MINGTKTEIDYIFRNAVFNLEQIEKIGYICKVLGKYMFVDRHMLEARAGVEIGLSYIIRATKHNIITQMKDESSSGPQNTYYYQLGMGGFNLLNKAGERYNDLNILAGREMKGRVLAFNYFTLENGYDISMKYIQDYKHRYFFCKKNIICYFPSAIKEMEIIRILIRMFSNQDGSPTSEQIRERFNFIPIDKKIMKLGAKTKGFI